MRDKVTAQLIVATQAAQAGDWQRAHEIAQDFNTPMANWLHAVLHKMEPDEWNSRYWYQRCPHDYETYADTRLELEAILQSLEGSAD